MAAPRFTCLRCSVQLRQAQCPLLQLLAHILRLRQAQSRPPASYSNQLIYSEAHSRAQTLPAHHEALCLSSSPLPCGSSCIFEPAGLEFCINFPLWKLKMQSGVWSGLIWRPEKPFPRHHQTKGKQVIGSICEIFILCISESFSIITAF